MSIHVKACIPKTIPPIKSWTTGLNYFDVEVKEDALLVKHTLKRPLDNLSPHLPSNKWSIRVNNYEMACHLYKKRGKHVDLELCVKRFDSVGSCEEGPIHGYDLVLQGIK
jgi:hypothetical protein